jgi:mRNA-degrading endonuclease RelE of RelBE toxin-antitoxin system
MSYKVFTIPQFEKELKRLAKKYPSLKTEYSELIQSLHEKPEQGTPIGNHCYKIRMAIASKGKGKSGGARVITYLQVLNTSVYLLSIYDKSEKENITNDELKDLLKYIPQ